MSNCARRTILRCPHITAHLGLQHLKAHARMQPLRQRLIDMRLAAACFKGPVFRYLYKRTNEAVKGISAVVKRSAPRQALCVRAVAVCMRGGVVVGVMCFTQRVFVTV